MTIRFYAYTDAGAIAAGLNMTTTAGKAIAILDACLINGYSVGTVSSITRSGSTATITFSAPHGLIAYGNIVTIAGCDQAEYNVSNVEVTITGASTVTYPVSGTPVSPATGTPTATKGGAGWTKPYSGTNLAAYLQGSGGNGHYCRVSDTGTSNFRWLGYETMSDVNTGTGAFPTNTQLANGLYQNKANAAADRAWYIVATSSYFYFIVNYTASATDNSPIFFGETQSRYSGTDNYNTVAIGYTTGASTNNQSLCSYSGANSAGWYTARIAAQTGTAINSGMMHSGNFGGWTATSGHLGLTAVNTYPDPVTNKLLMTSIYLGEGGATLGCRARIPLLLAPLHTRPLTPLDTFTLTDSEFNGYKAIVMLGQQNGQFFLRLQGPDF